MVHSSESLADSTSRSSEQTIALREQVADQCKVVAYLATAIAEVYSDLERVFRDGHADRIIPLRGKWSAEHMELLADILNGMDAVSKEDAWTDPVFEKAHANPWPDPFAHMRGDRSDEPARPAGNMNPIPSSDLKGE